MLVGAGGIMGWVPLDAQPRCPHAPLVRTRGKVGGMQGRGMTAAEDGRGRPTPCSLPP
jgi:hypothetical protein